MRWSVVHGASKHSTVAKTSLTAITDKDLRAGIGQLFDEAQRFIDANQVQVVIVAARRLACLYDLLLRLGMSPLSGAQVVSDRYLEIGTGDDSSGVLILDDSVVLGTTLHRLYNDASVRYPNAEVFCRTVVVDTEQKADFLLDGLNFSALYERTTDVVQKFASEIVEQLSIEQVPFFTDYLATAPLTVKSDAWYQYLGGSRWHVADVTAPLLGSETRHALAQVPTDETRRMILSRLVPAVAEIADTFKIRSYIRTDAGITRVVLVPLAILAPCSPEALDLCLDAFPDDAGQLLLKLWDSWKPEARQRVIQLYASLCVLVESRDDLQTVFSADDLSDMMAEMMSVDRLEVHFGVHAEAVRDALRVAVSHYGSVPAGVRAPSTPYRLDIPTSSQVLDDSGVQNILFETRELVADIGLPARPDVGMLTKVGLIFAHAFSSIFGYINDEFELPQRREIRELGTIAKYDLWLETGSARFLNQGFTLRELTEALVPECLSGDSWERSLVSLGIDMGNDLGIVVPVTRYDAQRNVVYRCYRLGETAFLASKPLVMVVQEDWPVYDELTKSVTGGYATRPEVVSISDSTSGGGGHSPQTLDSLLRTISQVIQGRLTGRYVGEVTTVGDGHFGARLRSAGDDHELFADMNIQQVASSQLKFVRPGAAFTWCTFAREFEGRAKSSTSRVRFFPPPPSFDPQELDMSADSPTVMTIFRHGAD